MVLKGLVRSVAIRIVRLTTVLIENIMSSFFENENKDPKDAHTDVRMIVRISEVTVSKSKPVYL